MIRLLSMPAMHVLNINGCTWVRVLEVWLIIQIERRKRSNVSGEMFSLQYLWY